MLPSESPSSKATSTPSQSTAAPIKDPVTINLPFTGSKETVPFKQELKGVTSNPEKELAPPEINTTALNVFWGVSRTNRPVATKHEDLILFDTPVCSLLTLDDIRYRPSPPFPEILRASAAFMKIPPRIVRKNLILHPIYPMTDASKLNLIHLSASDLKNIDLSKDKAIRIIVHFASILSQPRELLKLLQPIEQALSLELDKKGISFTEADDPSFIVEGPGLWILGPKKEGVAFKSKGRMLDQVLLKVEQSLGLNEQGSPIFVGFIDNDQADSFVEKGNIFKEDVSVSRLLLHGKHSHRLAFLALIESLKGTPFEAVTPTTLLKLLTRAKIGESQAWTYLLDTNRNITSIAPNSNTFNYNCRSPFILQSLILCFGNQLGVPNLMHCMRDSFWKSAYQMVEKVQKSNSSNEKISKAAIYTMIMKDFLTIGSLQDIGQSFSFSQKPKIAALDPKYQTHPSGIPGIKIKEAKEKELDPEKSKQNMFAMMRDQETLLEMIRQPETYGEIISQFLETKATIEELAQAGKLFTGSDLTPIFNEIVEKRCQSDENKLLFVHSLIKENSNDIAIKFIAAHFEQLEIVLKTLTDPQKENLLKSAIIEGLLDIVKEMVTSGVKIKQNYPGINHPIHTAITEGHEEMVYFIINSFPELVNIKDVNKETALNRIENLEANKQWNPKK